MKIVVLAGGTSTERSVSITSGTMVCKALREKNHQAVLVDVFCGIDVKGNLEDVFAEEAYDIDKAAEYMHSFDAGLNEMIESRRRFFGPNVLELCEAADVVFLALHGANGEDGKVQATFDLLGIPYTGTGYLSSALAMDKSITKQFFRAHNVPTPNGVTLKKGQESEPLSSFGLELPVVVKPCCGGSSVGVYIAHTNEEYWQAMKDAFSYEPEVVVEEYIEGREFSVGVVDGKAYPIIEIAPIEGFYDYTNKYKAGATVDTCPAVLTEEQTKEMQKHAEDGAAALGIENYCRLDFMMRKDGRMYCLEANTLPGMTPTSLLPQEAQVFLARPPAVEREACQLHEKGFDLAGKRVPCVGKGRRNQHTIIFQYPLDFLQGFLRLRHDMQCVGHDHRVEGLVRIRQAEHILHRKVQLRRSVVPLCLGDHLRGGVRRLDVRRRVYDVPCDQSRAGSKLQHRLVPHDRPDQLIHLVIRRPILSHKAVVTSGIFIPEILVFLHRYHSFQC